MRFYAYTPGEHGYISAEVASRDLSGEDEPRSWANDELAHNGRMIISRAQALMVPTYRDALDRWERRDDSILQETEIARIHAEWRDEAASIAVLGCRAARSALEARDDDVIHAVISSHAHNERCGGRYFPDDPKPRGLRSLG